MVVKAVTLELEKDLVDGNCKLSWVNDVLFEMVKSKMPDAFDQVLRLVHYHVKGQNILKYYTNSQLIWDSVDWKGLYGIIKDVRGLQQRFLKAIYEFQTDIFWPWINQNSSVLRLAEFLHVGDGDRMLVEHNWYVPSDCYSAVLLSLSDRQVACKNPSCRFAMCSYSTCRLYEEWSS
jgi:hypothetical protein